MLTLSMNSKRERRPNVRLREVGEIPAAVSFTHKLVDGEFWHNEWDYDAEKFELDANGTGYNFDLGFYSHAMEDFALIDSGEVEKDFAIADMQFNLENENPNSCKLGFTCLDSGEMEKDLATADMRCNLDNKNTNSCKLGFGPSSSEDTGLGMAKVVFGNVTKKRRVMNRKRRITNSGDLSFGNGRGCRISSYDSADNAKKNTKATSCFNSYGSSGSYPAIGSYSYSGPETSTTSKQDFIYYITEPPMATETPLAVENGSNSQEFVYHTDNEHLSKDETLAFTVDRWLETNGFGNYVEMFEMHEVDEEALPLLTFDDLKEMGVKAVGPRRKLYNAIQQLGGSSS